MIEPAVLMRVLADALNRNDRADTNIACHALIAARPPIGAQWRSVAAVLLENGELSAARDAIDLLVRATGGSPLGRFEQAATYARSGRVQQARDIMNGVPDTIPDPVGNAYIRGTIATNLGDFDQARTHLRRAVGLAPGSGQAWLALTMCGRLSERDAAGLLAAEALMNTAPATEQGPYLYALGKHRSDSGDHDGAFATFARGAVVASSVRPLDERGDEIDAHDALGDWTAETIATPFPGAAPTSRSIFVTGLPRSGTTLVEQVLAAHSDVDGGDELGLMRHIVRDVGGRSAAHVRQTAIAGKMTELANLYDHLVMERFPGIGMVVDKTLEASRHLGLITALFPTAPIVWLRRDPLDCAWSAFRTYFRHGMAWSFDQAAMARHMRREDILFEHWTKLRPDRILPVSYADLVTDPAALIPQIVAHCGLTLESQQMAPHELHRPVTTASVAQVRAPINRDGIGTAAPYRRRLQPFIDAYRAAGGTID